ncbi:Ankyrin-3 [Colletotrichum orbiculare MAFF 240422]|uniref:Ankyrin-3 n=1 Tax=Colletotrichum orbiculare (strain 104-T / ATCC 96160 / CBS 514.97 / LARS 414 / MAFF 240422) TaxID=1213857 RepID=A0A484FRV5_COLOR|nr:Ankyrin-3 [Colletotrichum orbiculare MAFF 240422]
MANEDGQSDAGPSSLSIDTQGAGNKEKLDKTTLTTPKTPKTPETPSRLRLRSHQPPKVGDQDEIVRVDVIHVTSLRSEEEMHTLEELLPEPEDNEEFRAYVFTLNLAEEVHQLATHEEASKCKRIIIWVAYDFGSLLVKLALAMLSQQDAPANGTVFRNTGVIVFSGCPQRSSTSQEMADKITEVMMTGKGKNSSPFAPNISGRIHPALDLSTATLGIANELAIPESDKENTASGHFTGLSTHVGTELKDCLPPRSWTATQEALLRLSAPHRPHKSNAALRLVLDTDIDALEQYRKWKNVVGHDILYIHGTSREATHSMEDQVLLTSMDRLRPKEPSVPGGFYSFTFDSRDPLRGSVTNMLASFALQAAADAGYITADCDLFSDLIQIQGTWNQRSQTSIMRALLQPEILPNDAVMLLYDFDECSYHDRTELLGGNYPPLLGPPDSALMAFVSLEAIEYSVLEDQDVSPQARDFARTILHGKCGQLPRLLTTEDSSALEADDLFVAACKLGDEDNALKFLSKILSSSRQAAPNPHFLRSALWTATFLNMSNLVERLLQAGVDPNPGTEKEMIWDYRLQHFPSLLYMASRLGFPEVVRSLLSHGARTHADGREVYGPCYEAAPAAALGAAARRGCFDAVCLLLERGADPNGPPPGESETDGSRWSPLASACLGGFPRTVEALLKGGADANGPGPGGKYTCLHVSAVMTPNVDCVRLLSRHGASKSRGPMLRPLIHNIAWSEYDHETAVRICDALLQTTSTPFEVDENDRYDRTALMVAGDKGNLPLTRWLLERGANVNAMDEDGRRPLHNAIFSGKLEVIMEVLNKMKPSELNEVHKSSKGSFASYLGLAATLENMEAVRILIEKGADINQKNTNGYTPIVFAVRRAGDPAMTRFFVEKGAKLDAETIGVQILHLSLYGPADTLKVLLEFRRYIDIDAKSSDGFTALHIAVLENLKGHVQLLFRAGADINSKDASGDTVLHFALRDKRSDIVSMILEAPEADINCVGERDGSPLQAACLHGDISGVDALLEHGADVNITVTNMLGSTPLMACSLHWGETSHEEDALRKDNLARRLVRMGAEVGQTVPGSRFYTALSAACYGAGTNTINFLLDEGASAQLADPIFGWLPQHFAAGNGVENFRAILHAFRGDMMTADKMGKNCLHWAAQSGNLEAVKYILGHLPKGLIDQADEDGWTALCWAARPLRQDRTRSERTNVSGVVKLLLEYGANPTVRCRFGETAERRTPLQLAEVFSADEETIDALRNALTNYPQRVNHKNEDLDGNPGVGVLRYSWDTQWCDICFATIYGLKYKCQSCPDYDVCSKCISKVGALHTGDTQGDALPHSFSPADEKEFVTPPPSPGPEPAMDKEAVGSETTQELRTSGEYTHDPNDELDELDALDMSLET